MARKKKSRKVTDIMPARKADKKPLAEKPRRGKKLTRYELDAKAREEKRKRKHKGLPSGSRHSVASDNNKPENTLRQDPRLGSRKKVPLVVEFVNKENKAPAKQYQPMDPVLELERLENNEILNELLDQLEAGKTLKPQDQAFVDECLQRIDELMQQLGMLEDEDDEENAEDLYRTFAHIDINQFK